MKPSTLSSLPLSFNCFYVPVVNLVVDHIHAIVQLLYTLYLFTKSDIITLLIPTTLFGTAAAPPSTTHLLGPRLFWVWLNLLHFAVANQSCDPEEDKLNKPWRPIPSLRISQRDARILRWILLPLCFILSVVYNIPLEGLILSLANIAHNEFKWDSHWFTRNLCNAVGYACFSTGASRVLCTSLDGMPQHSAYAQGLNAALIFTTIHAQDFRDMTGDEVIGRRTFPVLWPWASRLSMAVMLPAWSVFLSVFWEAHIVLAVSFTVLGTYVGFSFYLNKTDEVSLHKKAYKHYNIWLALAHIIPFVSILR